MQGHIMKCKVTKGIYKILKFVFFYEGFDCWNFYACIHWAVLNTKFVNFLYVDWNNFYCKICREFLVVIKHTSHTVNLYKARLTG